MAYEDAAVLATLLSDINNAHGSSCENPSSLSNGKKDSHVRVNGHRSSKKHQINAALAAYTVTRKDRTQWLVEASRYLGECYLLQAYGGKCDMEILKKDVLDRYDYIWKAQILDIVSSARTSRDSLIANTDTPMP